MLENVYYQVDSQAIYLRLDGVLRLIPDAATYAGLFGGPLNPAEVNRFANAGQAPFSIGYPLLSGAALYTLQGVSTTYFSDVYPWSLGQAVLRPVVNGTQLANLGFRAGAVRWNAQKPVPPIGVPLAIRTGRNWHLQTFLSGYYCYYNHLCHPENPINPFFASWLGNAFSKPEVKRRIIETQGQVDQLKGEVPVAKPVFSPAGGPTPYSRLVVGIACSTPDVTLYYTTDGTAPVPVVSTRYTGPVVLLLGGGTPSVVLKAVAECLDSIGASPVTSADYTYSPLPIAAPTFSPTQGDQSTLSVQVEILCVTAGASIRYTTDGTTPTATSPTYSTPVSLDLSVMGQTIRAIAVHDTYGGSSSVASATYRYVPAQLARPVFQPAGGSFITPRVAVTLTADPGAVIQYTTRGGAPSVSYAVPVPLDLASAPKNSVTLIAQATSTRGARPSELASQTYACSKAWSHVWELTDDAVDTAGDVDLAATQVTYQTLLGHAAAKLAGSSLLTTSEVASMQSPIFSVAAWVNVTTLPATEHCAVWLFEAIDSGINGPGVFIYSDGHFSGRTRQANGSYVMINTASGAAKQGVWMHCVLVADGRRLNLYVNGESVPNAPAYDGTLDRNACQRFNIGAEQGDAKNPGIRFGSKALIDRVYYIDSALSGADVLALYQAEQG